MKRLWCWLRGYHDISFETYHFQDVDGVIVLAVCQDCGKTLPWNAPVEEHD